MRFNAVQPLAERNGGLRTFACTVHSLQQERTSDGGQVAKHSVVGRF